jgi:hypothetical protein
VVNEEEEKQQGQKPGGRQKSEGQMNSPDVAPSIVMELLLLYGDTCVCY